MDQSTLLERYDQASDWVLATVRGAVGKLDCRTPCDGWDVRTLLNHMLDTQHYFVSAARGEDASPPSPAPPDLVGDDPVGSYARGRSEMLEAFARPGVAEEMGPALAVAFADQLVHGWDLATATNQDATMPEGLPDDAYRMIHGRVTDRQRAGVFKPAREVPPDASAQDRLLAYTGRDPAS